MSSIRDVYRSSDTLAAADLPDGVQVPVSSKRSGRSPSTTATSLKSVSAASGKCCCATKRTHTASRTSMATITTRGPARRFFFSAIERSSRVSLWIVFASCASRSRVPRRSSPRRPPHRARRTPTATTPIRTRRRPPPRRSPNSRPNASARLTCAATATSRFNFLCPTKPTSSTRA